MKFELAALACALALTPRADHAAPQRLGIEDVTQDSALKELSETTSVQILADELRQKLPKEPAA